MKNIQAILLFSILILSSCAGLREAPIQVIDIEEPIIITASREPRESPPRHHDLLHTKLAVEPQWHNQHLLGEATLTIKPLFYPQNQVVLDAQGFLIHEISLLRSDNRFPLQYTYDTFRLSITLDTIYTRNDTFRLLIRYTARPNELLVREGMAIRQDRGLYFINPLGEEPGKPRQIWTQGQPESNSRWFPTFDQPNERSSQEMAITVDTNFVTLSNGRLLYSMEHGNGKRTDYWKQELPHAPYLFMMAIGEFAEVRDYWRDTLDVFYYVEPAYEQYAQMVFGNTPEMITFFSEILGYEYPWDKYHQVVVRDFVAGAMENTGAVIFYDALQHDRRAHLDNTHESIIAHELGHHWFGNLVTTESWAHLALNESFATYCEYLWDEYKYGREQADYGLQNDLVRYFNEAQHKKESLIRPHFGTPNEMFDRHTYQKGALILHMLRKHVGDDAFFASLKYYLHDRQFNSAEYNHLRLAFEDVTGLDMNWFFNQWFLNAGHPQIEINTTISGNQVQIITTQQQDLSEFPLYRIPILVDLYTNAGVETKQVILRNISDTFNLQSNAEIRWVNFDSQKMLLAEISEEKPIGQWTLQFNEGPLYMDRFQALEGVFRNRANIGEAELRDFISQALNDDFWNIRRRTIELLNLLDSVWVRQHFENTLLSIGSADSVAAVRVTAVNKLNSYNSRQYQDFLISATRDSSYRVAATALSGLHGINPALAREHARPYRTTPSFHVLMSLARIYEMDALPTDNIFYMDAIMRLSGWQRYNFLSTYGRYLARATEAEREAARPLIQNLVDWAPGEWQRVAAMTVLNQL